MSDNAGLGHYNTTLERPQVSGQTLEPGIISQRSAPVPPPSPPIPAHLHLDQAIHLQLEVTDALRNLCQRVVDGEQADKLEKNPEPPRPPRNLNPSLRQLLDTGAKELNCCRDEQLELIAELNVLLFSSN